MKTFTTKNKKGFTLIEALVAIVILMFAITGPLTLAFRTMSYTKVAKDQVVATYLAQDAMEYIIAKKEANIQADAADWLEGITCVNECYVDTTGELAEGDLEACNPSDNSCLLYLNQTTKQYTHNPVGADPTEFKRYVEVVPPGSGESRIKVTVSWQSGVMTRTFSIETSIFDYEI